mgnify:CR=1 FL=1
MVISASAVTWVPRVPAMIARMSPSEPIAARRPGPDRTNCQAASTLGPIDPAGNGSAIRASGDAVAMARCSGVPQPR